MRVRDRGGGGVGGGGGGRVRVRVRVRVRRVRGGGWVGGGGRGRVRVGGWVGGGGGGRVRVGVTAHKKLGQQCRHQFRFTPGRPRGNPLGSKSLADFSNCQFFYSSMGRLDSPYLLLRQIVPP